MKLLRLPHVAQRIFNTPLAIEPGKLAVVLAAIGAKVVGREVDGDVDFSALLPAKGAKPDRESLTQIVDGVAMVDVSGTLVHRSSWMDAASGLASYEKLSEEIDRAHADTNVKAILLCLNSPGGEVSGMFEMAERIHSLRGKGKPIHAIASDMACSAAYLLGAACDKFYATEGAVTGSIGVVFTHLDVSEADKKAGVKVTQIHAGARKVDGNPHEPLSDEARESLEGLVNRTYDVYVARAAAYRGVMEDVLRTTEARVYVGSDATKAGIIDGVKSTRAALAELKRASAQPGLQFAAAAPFTITYTGFSGAAMEEADTPAPSMPKQEQCDCEGEEECDHCRKEPDALSAPATQPVEGATTEEAAMADPKDKGPTADVAALQARLNEALAEIEKQKAAADTAAAKAKAEVIEKHIRRGVAPAMRSMAEKLSATLDVDALDQELSALPVSTRPVPSGVANAAPPADAIPTGDALVDLAKVAAEVQKQHPAWTREKAYAEACRIRPDLYLNQRGSLAGQRIEGRA